jgi:sterol desaturase/sphingolipid hydroxylase (fatty acid hydroxylase superfamily)
MTKFIFSHEALIRLIFFFAILGLMAAWEMMTPRRRLSTSKKARWSANLGLVVIDTLTLRLIFPITAVNLALLAHDRGWGLFNSLQLSYGADVVIGLLALDFVIYLQHAMFHFLPTFWRLHRVHHTDLDFDVTTGIRFHPVEILLSLGIKMAVITFLGVPALAVVLFEIILNATSLFNHGNVRLPQTLDRGLRLFVVTPEMHRVHHSVVIKEYNSNFGFNLPWWDRLLGTYRAQPAAGHEGMTIGLALVRDPKKLTLPRLLIQPFLAAPEKPLH